MHIWQQAEPIPEYFSLDELLTAHWLTLPDEVDPRKNTNKYAGSDTMEEFAKNLKTQPDNWHYRTKEVEYLCNSKGYRTKELDSIDWKESIVLFGCSMTAGIGVAEDETISHFLEQKSGRPVINLGVPGSSLDFNLYNNFLLHKNYTKPWAVVNLWTNTHRLMTFTNMCIRFEGLWSEGDKYWEGYMTEKYNPILTSKFNMHLVKHLWKDTRTFYGSWFDDAAHYGDSYKLSFTNTARDLLHCGAHDNKRNATVIWTYLRDV